MLFRNFSVPCLKRATELESSAAHGEVALQGEEEGWVATHNEPGGDPASSAAADIPNMDDAPDLGADELDEGDIPDIEELDLEDDEVRRCLLSDLSKQDCVGDWFASVCSSLPCPQGPLTFPVPGTSCKLWCCLRGPCKHVSEACYQTMLQATLITARPQASSSGADNILRTRTYDLYITYDQYYQVPRCWLVGYDEAKRPLTPAQVLQDVSEEHARKTITVDPHPHLPVTAASIHPCK